MLFYVVAAAVLQWIDKRVVVRSLWDLVSVVVFYKYAFILASVERAVFNGPHVRSTGPAFFDTASESNCKVGSQFALEFAVSG